jgi:CheY-like chemotaxis protein
VSSTKATTEAFLTSRYIGGALADILTAIASLLWPIVVGALLVALLPMIRRLLNQSESIDIEVAGTKISIQKASEELRKLIGDLQDRVNELESVRGDASAHPEVHEPPAGLPMQSRSRVVLWVDDRLEANVYERARLAEAGWRVVHAESTKSALERMHNEGPFSLIISDMARVEVGGRLNLRAGLDLLRELRSVGDNTPVVFYSSSRSLEMVKAELEKAGNVSYTTSPSELMRILHVSSEG